MATALRDKDTVLFIGDSITDCGRRDIQNAPYGCGYVNRFRDMLITREPEKDVTIVNTGIGGNTIEDLRSRWVDDALAHRPDWLSIKIGINDCNRYCTRPEENELQSPEAYAEIFDELLTVTAKKLPNTQILLIDPFFASLDLDSDFPDSYRAKVHHTLPAYIDTVACMAGKYGTRHLKTNELFHNIFKHRPPSTFFPHEPVHPNHTGHMLVAEAVYQALS